MQIPDDLLKRLQMLGESPEQFSDILKSRGPEFLVSFLRCYVERREESLALHQTWAPKLRTYAAECRDRNECPDIATLPAPDRAKLVIYESKIAKAERLPTNRADVVICSLPLICISVAQRLWPGENTPSVILTPDELQEWQSIYQHPEEANWWWVDYWWNIEDRPDPGSRLYRNRDLRVADGESPWLVTSGLCLGPLAGGATTDLWSWNGREAKYVRNVSDMTF